MRYSSVLLRLCLVAALCAILWAVQPLPHTEDPTPAPTNEQVAVTTRAAPPYATVGQWEGKLAVFTPQSNTPHTVYDVFISSLPPTEQAALRAGIAVQNEAELQGLLEDYTG